MKYTVQFFDGEGFMFCTREFRNEQEAIDYGKRVCQSTTGPRYKIVRSI